MAALSHRRSTRHIQRVENYKKEAQWLVIMPKLACSSAQMSIRNVGLRYKAWVLGRLGWA